MADQYVPTTREVRLSASDYRKPITPSEFDSWLHQHDAEVRASVVPEEPEWEYGTESRFERSGAVVSTLGWGTREQAESVASERNAAEKDEDDDVRLTYMVMKRVSATSPGPWLPVEQEEE